MQSVGQILRSERERQNLTLEDISAKTRISCRNLQFIESDKLSEISSPFLYKSFVKQVAELLGANTPELAEALMASASSMPAPLVPGQDGLNGKTKNPPRVPKLSSSSRNNYGAQWIPAVLSLAAVLVGCSGVYMVWERTQGNVLSAAAEFGRSVWAHVPVRTASKPEPPVQAAHAVVPKPADVPSRNEDTRASAASTQADAGPAFSVEVSAVEKTWLSIVSDGRKVYSGVLKADESKSLEGHEEAKIKTGNAGGISVVFNGKLIGPLGPRGKIRTVVFTRDRFEIVEPDARAELTAFKRPYLLTHLIEPPVALRALLAQ